MSNKVKLDTIDHRILRDLQEDGRMTNVELAKRIGISARLVSAVCALWRKNR